MGSLESFRDLRSWEEHHEIILEIYILTKNFPEDEQFGLCSQIRRSASSITANLAEGFGRYYFKDKIRFYYMARSSNTETQNHLILASDLGYIQRETAEDLILRLIRGQKSINGLIKSTREQDNRNYYYFPLFTNYEIKILRRGSKCYRFPPFIKI
ncbi:four helix bundle protein [Candidatus Falkowbacteria bacterium CG10_big_fil_rev_8_21_14_0_10_39_11]|uniref:Four helix bundle protein n=1 Tax=Candidatus Falkowbacteria bacterium CG10_big_fil_rev_8_21_14_0_10_39_11 TaxID=1974565 RepID=A0A2H0V6P6_9BACT|nr:MAG: four helix bundle protein [Candidatus Falkowbacteria bacterium CG10_big_fil_rev_8_21_14_0_10_39_11]